MSRQNHNLVEILCIGTELLLGNIKNGNAQWISKELASIGLPHFRQSVVGDNLEKIQLIVKESSKRCNILIITGGLGPTSDDLTKEAIALTFQEPLLQSKEALIEIKSKFKYSSNPIPECNYKQALFPYSAKIISNPCGTAPGMIWEPIPNFKIITLPGVPMEMKQMWKESVKNWLKENVYNEGIFKSRTLNFSGVSESLLSEKVKDLLTNKNPTVAPYASSSLVKLRITAKAKDNSSAQDLLDPIEKEIMKRVGNYFFGYNEESLAKKIVSLLVDRKETLSTAESCTGGSLGATLTSIPGVSSIFLGGIIAYSNLTKENVLNVQKNLIEKHGAVSSEVVKAMAEGVKKQLSSDWSIAISGIAGPLGGTKDKPVGFVQIGISGPNFIKTIPINFGSHRKRIEIQELSVARALNELRIILINQT